MEVPTAVTKVPFDKLIHLFVERCERCQYRFILPSSVGSGDVQIFDLEKGLQAQFWNCYFNETVETYNDVNAETRNRYFTLAFFLKTKGLQFCNRGTFLQGNTIWDTLFISEASSYQICITPDSPINCLSISFSKKWLNNNVLKDGAAFKSLRENIEINRPFSLLESMNASEKEVVQELLNASWKKSFGSFYVKCQILKIVCDFFHKIREREIFTSNPCLDVLMSEVETYLCNHHASQLPNLKDLAHHFSISEPTLKRHFKKRYGVNMSTYFYQKKMKYAQHLIDEKKMSVAEVAQVLGYQNVKNFMTMFTKLNEK